MIDQELTDQHHQVPADELVSPRQQESTSISMKLKDIREFIQKSNLNKKSNAKGKNILNRVGHTAIKKSKI